MRTVRKGIRRAPALEHDLQAAVFIWRELAVKQNPELALLHAVPNGARLPYRKKVLLNGKTVRICPEAKKLKREGLTNGIPDVCWPVPRGPFHGLYIEHKVGDNDLTDDQSRIVGMLQRHGYAVHVSYSSDESIAIIRRYWGLGPYRHVQGDSP